MNKNCGPMMLALVLLCAPVLWAQQGGTDTSSSGDDQSTDQSPSSPGPKVAFTHPETLPPLSLLSEAAASTGITLGVTTAVVQDTNGGGFSSNSQAQTFLSFLPNINILQYRSKTFWSFYYSGGLEFDPQLPRQNLFSNNAHVEFLHQLSKRWQVHVKDTYMYTANPYAAYETFHSAPTPNNPNPTIYLPNGIIESNQGNISLTYTMGAHDAITFGGGESFRRYFDVQQSTLNTYSYGGYSYYQHDFSARLAAGTGYSFTALDFGHGESRSGIQMVTLFGQYQFNARWSAGAWVGPQYTTTKDIIPVIIFPPFYYLKVEHSKTFDMAAGLNASYAGEKNAFRIRLTRQITDGGGLLGIVELYMASVDYTRALTPRWTLVTSATYGNNDSKSELFADHKFSSLITVAGLTRRFSPSLLATFNYAHFHETQQGIYGPEFPSYDDNRIGVTLRYNWGHSLGR